MARGHNNPESLIASCADYDEQADEEVVDTKKVANVAAKRSSQQMTPAPAPTDVASDSGYSSRTQATEASADSVASVNLKSAKAAAKVSSSTGVDNNAPPGPSRRRTTENGASQAQPQNNSSTAPQRDAPPKQKRRVVTVQCKDPDCDKCVAARGRKPKRKVTISTNPSPEKSPAKAQSDTRPSRPSTRPTLYPIQTQGVRRPSSSGARPQSMYDVSAAKMMAAGPPPSMYNRGYPAPSYHPGAVAIVERPGPINRSISARQAHPVSIHGNGVTYNPNAGMQLSARRPLKASVVQSESEEEDDPRKLRRMQLAPRQLPVQAMQSESEEEDSEEDEDEEDEAEAAAIAEAERRRKILIFQRENKAAELQRNIAAAEARNLQLRQLQQRQQQEQLLQEQRRQQERMPPPPLPQHNEQTYSMRKAMAPLITHGGRRPSMNDNDDILRTAFRDLNQGTSANRRPSLASSNGTKATSYSQTTGNARLTVEDNRRRRASYVGSEDHAGLAAMHARMAHTQQPDLQSIIVDAVRQQMDNLKLTPTQTGRSRMHLDAQMQEALKYQNRTDANNSLPRDTLGDHRQMPLTEAALRHKTTAPSHAASSRSNPSSDEGYTRISAGHRLTTGSESGAVTVNGDEMKVRIDTTNGFEMEFEGRRVMLLPTGEGNTAELIIGGKRDTAYHSTRGSTITASAMGRSKVGRTPSTRDTRERDTRDRELDRERERERERRNRKERRQRRYEEEEEEDDDSESDEAPLPSRRGGGRRRAETYDSEHSRAAPVRKPPPQSPRESRDDRHDDYPSQRGSRQQPPYAPGPSYGGYNGRGPKGPPSNVFGA